MTSMNGKRQIEREIGGDETLIKRTKIANDNTVIISVKQEKIDIGTNRDIQNDNNQNNANNFNGYTQRFVVKNSLPISYPQIAIKKKINDTNTGDNEVQFLLNGNWEETNTIPNIVAEMHNVKLEEIQNTWAAENAERFYMEMKDKKTIKKDTEFTTPSPQGSDSGLGNDSPEGNLSWLLNFKLDEIPGLPVSDYTTTNNTPSYGSNRKSTDSHAKISPVYVTETVPKQYYDNQVQNQVNITRIYQDQQQILSAENAAISSKSNHSQSNRYDSARKPPFTYTELIEHALREKGELTVSGIYQWISDHFSFYKANDDRWKNSVRHNLSINPHFRKGSKAVHGAGHLWTIAQKDDDYKSATSWNVKKQRMQQFMQSTATEWQRQHEQEIELAAATASIIQPDSEPFDVQHEKSKPRTLMHQTAEEILGGVKREVEVQYVIPVGNSMDFMCPVSKEQVAEECGLGNDELNSNSDYLITDLNPNTLGLNLTEAEIITTDQLFSDDLNFQCYELSTEQ